VVTVQPLLPGEIQFDGWQSLNHQHKAEVDDRLARHEKHCAGLKKEIGALKEFSAEEEKAHKITHSKLEQTTAELADARNLNVKQQRDHEAAMQQEKSDAEKRRKADMDRLVEEHVSEMTSLNEEFLRTKSAMEERTQALESQLSELEERYLARESRPEDLQLIARLKEEVAAKDVEVKKVREEMAYFKRELLNREENFNKTFQSQPRVGVMQVVKTNNSMGGPTMNVGNMVKQPSKSNIVW